MAYCLNVLKLNYNYSSFCYYDQRSSVDTVRFFEDWDSFCESLVGPTKSPLELDFDVY